MSTVGNLTDYGERITIAYLLTQIATIHLMSVAGGETPGGGTEFTAVDYAGQAHTFAVDPGDTSRIINSGGAIAFGTPATNWGSCVELRGRNGYGEDVMYWTLAPAVLCEQGAPVRIPVSMLIEYMQ